MATEFGKSGVCLSGTKSASAKAAGHSPAVQAGLPPEIVQGIYRYTKLAGAVYSVYRETTHKYIGLALYDGKEFTDCNVQTLITSLDESKDRK